MTTVGFLLHQLDNRGTGNAVYDYAQYNELFLNNKSRIYTFHYGDHSNIAKERFEKRFNITYLTHANEVSDVDVLYHIKYGEDDGFRIDPNIRYVVHAVFSIVPHGDKYAAVSKWLADKGGIGDNFVPHIIDPAWCSHDYREKLEIPEKALVIGRHGGYDTFDIPWAWTGVEKALAKFPDVYFVFLNTKPEYQHERVHYLEEAGPEEKRIFLNTCNAMLHARFRGETFGIAVGEFAVLGKPIMTYADSPERAHIEELGDSGLYYTNAEGIVENIETLLTERKLKFAYMQYSYTGVMKRFKEKFLD